MKAALKTEEGTFQVTDVEKPVIPEPGFVLARVRMAGVCGTDLRHWRKPEPELVGHITGHELAGEVTEVGDGVTNVKPGDRVVIESVMGDGVCEHCRIQRYNVCEHLYDVRTKYVSRAYGQFVVGPASKFYRLPDHVSFEEAALIDTFAVSLHAQHLSGLTINDKVAVIGAGPIGLAQLILAKATGAEVIIGDVVQSALELAARLGADRTVNGATDDPVERAREFTGGRGVDVAFECAGGDSMPQTLPQATKMARRGGKVVIVGGFDAGATSIPLEWQRLQMGEIQLILSASFAFRDIHPEQGEVLELIARGTIDVKPLITHRFTLDQINEAFDVAQNKQESGAVFVAISLE